MSYALGDVFFLWSTRGLGVSGSLAIASTYPLWAVLVNWLFRGETMSFLKLLGLVLVVVGTIQVILSAKVQAVEKKVHSNSLLSSKKMGAFLALLTSVMWAVNAYSVFQGGQGVTTAAANVYRMGFALVLSPLLGQLYAAGARPFLPKLILKRYLWVFILEGFGGTFMYMYGISHVPLPIGLALSSLAPVIVVPIAIITRIEKFSLARSLGVMVVVLGIFLLLSH